jgi:hypothetical protein
VLGTLDGTILPTIREELETIDKSVRAILSVIKRHGTEERLVERIYNEWLALRALLDPVEVARSILRADPDIEKYGLAPEMMSCWEWRDVMPCRSIGVVIIKETGEPALVYHNHPFTLYETKSGAECLYRFKCTEPQPSQPLPGGL